MGYFDRSHSNLKPMPICLKFMMKNGAYWSANLSQGVIELNFGLMPQDLHRKLCLKVFNSEEIPPIPEAIIYEPHMGQAVTVREIIVVLQKELSMLFRAILISHQRQYLEPEFMQDQHLIELNIDKGFPGFRIHLPILKSGLEESLAAYAPVFHALDVPIQSEVVTFWGNMHELIDDARSKFCYREKCPDQSQFRTVVIHFMQYCLYECSSAYDVLGNLAYCEIEEEMQTVIKSNGFDAFLHAYIDGSNNALLKLLQLGKRVLYALFHNSHVPDADQKIQFIVKNCMRDRLARAMLAYYFHLSEPAKLKIYLAQYYKIHFKIAHDSIHARLANICQGDMFVAILGSKEYCGKFLDYMKGKLKYDKSLSQQLSSMSDEQMIQGVERCLDDFLSLQAADAMANGISSDDELPSLVLSGHASPTIFATFSDAMPVPEVVAGESLEAYSSRMQQWAHAQNSNCRF